MEPIQLGNKIPPFAGDSVDVLDGSSPLFLSDKDKHDAPPVLVLFFVPFLVLFLLLFGASDEGEHNGPPDVLLLGTVLLAIVVGLLFGCPFFNTGLASSFRLFNWDRVGLLGISLR